MEFFNEPFHFSEQYFFAFCKDFISKLSL